MHENSIIAFKNISKSGKRGERRGLILNFFKMYKDRCFTDRQVMLALGFNDMNQVRPRITELYKLKNSKGEPIPILEESERVIMKGTNIPVRKSRIVSRLRRLKSCK